MIILLYTSDVMVERKKKLKTCTGTTVQKLSVVLTVNLSNVNA